MLQVSLHCDFLFFFFLFSYCCSQCNVVLLYTFTLMTWDLCLKTLDNQDDMLKNRIFYCCNMMIQLFVYYKFNKCINTLRNLNSLSHFLSKGQQMHIQMLRAKSPTRKERCSSYWGIRFKWFSPEYSIQWGEIKITAFVDYLAVRQEGIDCIWAHSGTSCTHV